MSRLIRFFFHGVLWVYIFSIPVKNKPLFDHVSTFSTDNIVFKKLRSEVVEFWTKLENTTHKSVEQIETVKKLSTKNEDKPSQ